MDKIVELVIYVDIKYINKLTCIREHL